jgi:hypothetical protein
MATEANCECSGLGPQRLKNALIILRPHTQTEQWGNWNEAIRTEYGVNWIRTIKTKTEFMLDGRERKTCVGTIKLSFT